MRHRYVFPTRVEGPMSAIRAGGLQIEAMVPVPMIRKRAIGTVWTSDGGYSVSDETFTRETVYRYGLYWARENKKAGVFTLAGRRITALELYGLFGAAWPVGWSGEWFPVKEEGQPAPGYSRTIDGRITLYADDLYWPAIMQAGVDPRLSGPSWQSDCFDLNEGDTLLAVTDSRHAQRALFTAASAAIDRWLDS